MECMTNMILIIAIRMEHMPSAILDVWIQTCHTNSELTLGTPSVKIDLKITHFMYCIHCAMKEISQIINPDYLKQK